MATIIISMLKEDIYTNVKLVLPLANPPIMMFVGRGGEEGGLRARNYFIHFTFFSVLHLKLNATWIQKIEKHNIARYTGNQ